MYTRASFLSPAVSLALITERAVRKNLTEAFPDSPINHERLEKLRILLSSNADVSYPYGEAAARMLLVTAWKVT